MAAHGATGAVEGILATAGVDGGVILDLAAQAAQAKAAAAMASGAPPPSSLSAAGGASERALSLLQWAARQAREGGAVDAGDEAAVERSYMKLCKLVPGLLGMEEKPVAAAPPAAATPAAAAEGAAFIAAPNFQGAKPGYEFKAGAQGTGYYRQPDAAGGEDAGGGSISPAYVAEEDGPGDEIDEDNFDGGYGGFGDMWGSA